MTDSVHERLADSPSVRSDIAQARSLVDSAWLHVMRSANALNAPPTARADHHPPHGFRRVAQGANECS